jgi:hypothetical protein
MLKKITLSLGFLFCFLVGFSQNPTSIKVTGKVVETADGKPVPVANVVAIRLLDSTRTGNATDFDGNFEFTVPGEGSYTLEVTEIGHKTLIRNINIPNNGLDLGSLQIEESAKNLDIVKIEDKAVQGIQLGDTTQFNSSAFKTNPDANAEDLITKMPGVTLQDGKVQAQGEDVKQILIDGKPYFGNDVNAALKSLPADVIDKVQVFDQQSEQSRFSGFDDGTTTKTINIVTKADMRDGIFGKVSAGYGYPEKYVANGNFNYFNGDRRVTVLVQSNNINQQNFSTDDLLGVSAGSSGGGGGRRGGGGPGGGRPGGGGGGSDAGGFLVNVRNGISTTHAAGLNYSDNWGKKIKVTGSYFFNWSNTKANQDLRRNYLVTGDSAQTYMENSNSESRNINHRVNFRMEYAIDSFNILTITPRVTIQQNSGNSIFSGTGERGGGLLNTTASDFISDLSALNFGNEINYRHRFKKAGRTLTLNVNMGYTTNSGNSSLKSQNNYFIGTTPSDTLNQESNLFGRGYNIGTRIVYAEPLAKGHILQFNYSNSYQNNLSDKRTFNYDGMAMGYNRIDSLLSNNISSNYHTESGGLGYRYSNQKAQFNVNVAYQWSELNNKNRFPNNNSFTKTFGNVLPMAMFRYNFTKQKNMRIRYSARTSVPSVDKFQAVVNNSNPLLLSTGNPDLKQDYSHNLFLQYSATNTKKSHVFFFMIGGSATQNYIANNTIIARSDTTVNGNIFLPSGAQLSAPVNLSGYYSARSFMTYGLPLAFMKCNLNINLGANYTRTPGMINSQVNYSNSPSGSVGITISSNISKKIDFTLASNSSMTFVKNSLRRNLNSNYFNQNTRAKVYWDIWKGIVVTSELTHQLYSGLSDGFNQNYFLWNVSLAKKFLKNDAAEFKFTAFDVLNQNNSITRNITDVYTEDVETAVLNRYFMLTFTYNFRTFKKKEI